MVHTKGTYRLIVLGIAIAATSVNLRAQGVYDEVSADPYDDIYTSVVSYGGSCGSPYIYSTLNGSEADGYSVYQTLAANPGADYTWNWSYSQPWSSPTGCAVITISYDWLIGIHTTSYGPPPYVTQDTCTYTMLACAYGTPKCNKSSYPGITFVPACPSYMLGQWLVLTGNCIAVYGAASAPGPGPCN